MLPAGRTASGSPGRPGAGKSTLTGALIRYWRDQGKSVAVVAVDPSSPRTGGALLGDRIRMESVALDPGVFIRSMATRGALGGLAQGTRAVSDVLDAAGSTSSSWRRWVWARPSSTWSPRPIRRCWCWCPESGDGIQALKSGLMEVADVFAVNKADRPGAERMVGEIRLALKLGDHERESRVARAGCRRLSRPSRRRRWGSKTWRGKSNGTAGCGAPQRGDTLHQMSIAIAAGIANTTRNVGQLLNEGVTPAHAEPHVDCRREKPAREEETGRARKAGRPVRSRRTPSHQQADGQQGESTCDDHDGMDAGDGVHARIMSGEAGVVKPS